MTLQPTPWATMATLPPGSGSGPDLRERMEPVDQIEADGLARFAPGPFPIDPARRFDIEAIQELIDCHNYAVAAYYSGPEGDRDDWARLMNLVEDAHAIAAKLCRRRDEREGR